MYKTSFNNLEISVEGVYSAYNLSQSELEDLTRKFGPRNINGSNGNYTIYKNAKRSVYLTLFVHEIWLPIKIDIREVLLRLYDSERLYKKNIENLSKALKKMRIQLHVDYNWTSNFWYITDFEAFIQILQKLIAEQKKSAG